MDQERLNQILAKATGPKPVMTPHDMVAVLVHLLGEIGSLKLRLAEVEEQLGPVQGGLGK